jgi:hypothetical membrane protein
VVFTLPLLKAGYDPVRQAISDGAIGHLGWLQAVAFFGLGLGSIAAAAAMRPAFKGALAAVGFGLLVLWGVGITLAGVFRADVTDGPDTASGTIHIAASLLSFLFILVAMIIHSIVLRRTPAWRAVALPSAVLTGAAILAFFAVAATEGSTFWGLMQRIFVGLLVSWLLVMTWSAKRRLAHALPTPTAPDSLAPVPERGVR